MSIFISKIRVSKKASNPLIVGEYFTMVCLTLGFKFISVLQKAQRSSSNFSSSSLQRQKQTKYREYIHYRGISRLNTDRYIHYRGRSRLNTDRYIHYRGRSRLKTDRYIHYRGRSRLNTVRYIHYRGRSRLNTDSIFITEVEVD